MLLPAMKRKPKLPKKLPWENNLYTSENNIYLNNLF